eukprot:207035_1
MIVLKTKIVLFVSVLLALQGITNAVDTNDHVWLMTMIAVAVCVLIAPVIILVTHATIMTKMPQERLEYAYAFSAGALISLAYMSLMIEVCCGQFMTAGPILQCLLLHAYVYF